MFALRRYLHDVRLKGELAMYRWLAFLAFTACGGSPFSIAPGDGAAPDVVLEQDTGVAGDVLEHDDQWLAGDVLEHDQAAGDVLEHDPDAVVGDVSAPGQDAGDAAPDAPPNPCPAQGCLCESNLGGCPQLLPFVCDQGAECCNWRPPGC